MTLIGMLHHRKDPTTVIKSYAYAAVAKAEGATFFYFSPGQVNFTTSKINGYVYENGKWVEKVMPFPDVIYNAGSPEKLNKSKDIIQKLKEKIPFTTHSIGNKWNVQKRLNEAKEFSNYLIPSEIIKSSDSFFKYVETFDKVVFKPIDGRKGKGIYFITKKADGFQVQTDLNSRFYTTQQLTNLIRERVKNGTYILQPYITSVTKSGQVFDFRLHVQKNGEGKWVITTIYPRIAPMGSIIANINNGGYTNYLDPFLEQEFKDNAFNIKRTLEHFSLSLAKHLDELQMVLYDEVIDEIGIDVGLDQNNKIWIYEVNWRPGCPPAFYLELDVVTNSIRYAMYLAKNQQTIKAQIRQLKREQNKVKRELPIIAITGSAGKTTSKAFLASILSKKWNVFESKDYWNTTEHTKQHKELIDPSHQAVVLEYGMAYKGVITEHCKIIKPNISIVTNIGLAHVGNFNSDIRGVAHAKSELIHGMDQQGLLIVNKDDANSRYLETQRFKGKILTVGIKSAADYRAFDVKYAKEGMEFKIRLQGKVNQLYIPILGEHHVYNALNAIAVADQLGFSPMDIKAGLIFKKPPRRLTIYNCKNNITVIDDTVHSHPQGVRAAIDVLSNIGKHRTIAIIGQMRELGDLREAEYRKLGEYVVSKKIDYLITYGFRTDEITNHAKAKGFPAQRLYHFTDKDKLHDLLSKIIRSNDTILVKGASKTNMFETVKFLDEKYG
ncbi:YheC/YheD family protein [Lederbergia wuyishanensis]|uniref:UDP-N-acetylmuramoyl-tripeptide--D-alanyl-D-alanine ligase n=1 Tax=Lederbergia wuyishanensis TaxID=1347903 RepID=A0ABU0D5C2_9BACI|nr:YheC/YheD family protein [Lederbergia wuyishanensis]MCJ8009851.1 YheC/YheD family protein [Lederbergia wuyishanensis]MDQ0343612.1 UDP-N-acetylmuramoyl-tripeptide--D-alanyl-D-alanine ligase [Lederbergia wuyishanensis]